MGKEHEVIRVVLDSLGCKLNQAESELSGTGSKRKRQPGERQSNQLFKRFDTEKGGLTKSMSLFIIAHKIMKMLIGKEVASRLKLHPQTVYRWYMLAS